MFATRGNKQLFCFISNAFMLSRFSQVQLSVTPWTVVRQAPLSMGCSRQEYWSRLPCPPPGGSSRPRDWNCISYISCMGRQVLAVLSKWLWKGVISGVSSAAIQGKVFGNVKVHPSVRFRKVKVAQLCLTLCDPMDCSPRNSPGQNTGVGSLSLLQGIFPTQGLNPGLETKS